MQALFSIIGQPIFSFKGQNEHIDDSFLEIFSKISRSVQVDFTRALLPRPVTYNFQFDNCRSKILSTIQKFKVFILKITVLKIINVMSGI